MNIDQVLAQLIDSIDQLANRQAELENQHARQAQLAGFDHDPDDVSEPVIPRRRELVDDPEQRAQMDTELHAWVAWLVNRYRLTLKIPACWHEHGQLVEELTALWYAWRTAWITPTTGWDPTRWHHDLANTLHRITNTYPITCTGTNHQAAGDTCRTAATRPIQRAPWWFASRFGDNSETRQVATP